MSQFLATGAALALVLLTVPAGAAQTLAAGQTLAGGTTAGAGAAAFVPGEDRPGGAATTDKTRDRAVFSQSSANMGFEKELAFKVGTGVFRKLRTSAPRSQTWSDGLGARDNARS